MAEKKKPVKKTTAKKAAPKKAAPKKAVAKKVPAKKKAPAKKPVAKKTAPVQEFRAEDLVTSVSGIAPQTQAVVTQSEVIHANDVKSPKTRKRMLKWFKKN